MNKYGDVRMGQHFTLRIFGEVPKKECTTLIKNGEIDVGVRFEFGGDMDWDDVLGAEDETIVGGTIGVILQEEKRVLLALEVNLSSEGSRTGNFGCLLSGNEYTGALEGTRGDSLGVAEMTLGSDQKFRSKEPTKGEMKVSVVKCLPSDGGNNATCDLKLI